MAGILSQREIDALLTSLPQPGGTVPAPEFDTERPVKVYDFRHPDKFSKDQIHTLEMVNENFARRAGVSLSTHLRTIVTSTLIGVDAQSYDEYIQQVPNPGVLYTINLDPLPGRALLELHPEIAFIAVDRMLGGFGKGVSRARELTDVELTLLESIVWEVLMAFKEAWGNITNVDPKLGEVAFTPQFLQIALPTDICLIITCEVKIVESVGFIRVCIPYTVVEPVMSQLSAQAFYASSRKDLEPEEQRDLRRQMDLVTVQLVAQLGKTKLRVEEITNLKVGDVIALDSQTDQDLEVMLVGETKFYGRPGLRRRRISIQLTDVVEDPWEDEEEGLGV